jgi:hypothetical protein
MAPRPGPSSTTHEPCDESSFASATSRSMMILSVRKCWLSSVLRRMELSPLSSLAMRFRLLLRVLRFNRRRSLREGPSSDAPSAAAAPGDVPASCIHNEAPARRDSFLSVDRRPRAPLPSCGHVAPEPMTRQGRGGRWKAAGRSRPRGECGSPSTSPADSRTILPRMARYPRSRPIVTFTIAALPLAPRSAPAFGSVIRVRDKERAQTCTEEGRGRGGAEDGSWDELAAHAVGNHCGADLASRGVWALRDDQGDQQQRLERLGCIPRGATLTGGTTLPVAGPRAPCCLSVGLLQIRHARGVCRRVRPRALAHGSPDEHTTAVCQAAIERRVNALWGSRRERACGCLLGERPGRQ